MPTVGWLSPGVRSNRSNLQDAFVKGLRDLGCVEGQNIIIDRRDAQGRLERLPGLAAELVRLGVDVIVTTEGVPATSAAKDATRSIPIVMTEAGDPVRTGLVASLGRPGGNATGVSMIGDCGALQSNLPGHDPVREGRADGGSGVAFDNFADGRANR
jgi:putative ABC transport system substrate-binding protein